MLKDGMEATMQKLCSRKERPPADNAQTRVVAKSDLPAWAQKQINKNYGIENIDYAEPICKIYSYSFPSRFIPQVKILSEIEISQLIERMEFFLECTSYLKNLPEISSDLLQFIARVEYLLETKGRSSKFDDFFKKVLGDIEAEYNIQQAGKSVQVPQTFLNRISRLKNTSYLDKLNRLENFLKTKGYLDKFNSSVEKTLDDFEKANRISQAISKNPIINLVELLKITSDKKTMVAPQYINKLNSDLAEVEAHIEHGIEALIREKIATNKRLENQKREIENRITSVLEAIEMANVT